MRNTSSLVRRTAVALACAAALGSCAQLEPFAPDLKATAPRLSGFGTSTIAITSASDRARALFNDGVLQAYAFNEVEAVRMFKAALAQDPACAMCAWGVAWQLGPNINNSSRKQAAEALQYVGYAMKHAAAATPRERALIESLAVRYAHPSAARETAPYTAVCGAKREDGSEPPHPLDIAYAARMRTLADAYPADPDIASLYAEAEIIATDADNGWTRDGKPNGRIGEVLDRVEKLLPSHTTHTGLNHYMVHLADGAAPARRAVAAADRLAQLAPQSPHLVHMPSHIYVHVGRYDDAARVNQLAETAEAALDATHKAQGFETTKDWRGHNRHFLWYAAIMAGRDDVALDAAAKVAAMLDGSPLYFAEYTRSLRLLTLVRMEQWDRVLAEPLPPGDKGVTQLWYEHARGIAQARLGRMDEAQASLARLQALATSMRGNAALNPRQKALVATHTGIAEAGLQAQVAAARRNFAEAISHQQAAMKAAQKSDQREPPEFADGTLIALGDIQLAAGRAAEAEATFRTALEEHPGSGWALRGLARALQAQGKAAEASVARQQMERAWPQAAAALRRV
ncbi:tetratricopeptide repeat protein [Ramlibacter albus]|uniref:Tetratricopeptide repeat protein n=1 Tax=Ramlibacter albus TaxID=2079448 RepID=A0A923S3Q3_9BURK|nr:tetratricopeptide repeat protein [Ramlibacter albus]MBC5763342.1 tetratricopeptide repeat protein [Ramlibacter albus]